MLLCCAGFAGFVCCCALLCGFVCGCGCWGAGYEQVGAISTYQALCRFPVDRQSEGMIHLMEFTCKHKLIDFCRQYMAICRYQHDGS